MPSRTLSESDGVEHIINVVSRFDLLTELRHNGLTGLRFTTFKGDAQDIGSLLTVQL